jgi:hypothetical protein
LSSDDALPRAVCCAAQQFAQVRART